ncbi:MAG: hypothetical protein FD189_1106 [Elusimicrobia bacterium]|nr:MAG: hypothetical protein FD189_1106 [Elusimicrobiota bacterium]
MDFDLRRLLGAEKGRPAYVLAGGPSLLSLDPAELGGAVLLGVNHAVWLHERLGFPQLDHWFFFDIVVPESIADPRDYPGVRVWTDITTGAFLRGRGLRQGRDYETVLLGSCMEPERTDGKLHTRGSTLGAALTFAWLLGCDPIYVRGLDFQNDAEGRTHWFAPPGAGEPNARGQPLSATDYRPQVDFLRGLLAHVKASGVTVTVKAAAWLADGPYVPPWLQEPVVGETPMCAPRAMA